MFFFKAKEALANVLSELNARIYKSVLAPVLSDALDLSAYVQEQLPKITQEISETAIEMSVISLSIAEKGVVEFVAFFSEQGRAGSAPQQLRESSDFICDNDTWYYLKGKMIFK